MPVNRKPREGIYRQLNQLYNQHMGRTDNMMINSEAFPKEMKYELVGDYIAILTRDSGILSIPRMELGAFVQELQDIAEVHGRVL